MPSLAYSVSRVDCFRAWEDDQESDLGWLIKALTGKEETEDMKRGTAFHAALETIKDGEVDRIDSQGFTFLFDGDFEIPSWPVREIRKSKNYNGLTVTGQVDAILGNHILDHKAATWFDAERYMRKYAWRYYLDIFEANLFTWYVWEMQETDESRVWMVRDLHILDQYRYPDLERDCAALAGRMKDFAEKWLINKPQPIVKAPDPLEIQPEDCVLEDRPRFNNVSRIEDFFKPQPMKAK